MSRLRLGVLVSGSGSNLQSVIDATLEEKIESRVVCVISNKEEAYGLERARNNQIPAYFVNPKSPDYDREVLERLEEAEVDLVVLAGYLRIIPTELIEKYRGRIINIHPSLLPKFGGKGYYGIRVHEAVIAACECESGATVHYVDEGIDTGKTILQRSVPVLEADTPKDLAERVLHEVEHRILVEAIGLIEKGDVQ
ncbi:MAG: phosphoribosylglycinamide formyltransferase [Cellulosilyticaceae bacterium]